MKKIEFTVMILLLLTTALTINLVWAGDVVTLGTEKTIDISDLTGWADVENITDTAEDNLNQTITNMTDITNVWMCNNFTYLFVRVDVAVDFNTTKNFAIQLYIEDANGTVAGNDTLLYTNVSPLDKNDINATYLFSVWSNGTFYRYSYNLTDAKWTMDENLTDTNFHCVNNSFIIMIDLTLLSSTGEIYTGNEFKFEIFTAYSSDGIEWFVADYLDYGIYTITGTVIPEFPSLVILMILLIFVGFLLTATKKMKLFQ